MKAKEKSTRKDEYTKYVHKNLTKLKSMAPQDGLKKKYYKAGHHVIKKPMPGYMIIGLEGSSLDCIEECDIEHIHGFPEGIHIGD